MKRCLLPVFLVLALAVQAQQVRVPEHIYFADLDLTITGKGQEEIQKYVDYLVRHPDSYRMRVDQADTYFPVIERVFREEGLPDDFKYLVLQESGLISDAVSTSNAVGFWQFKKEAASDMGLLMTGSVDERKHIIESSRAAARFLSKHNLYFNNWLYTLLSHNLGFTGAKNTVDAKYIGKKVMEIDARTHVYILKYLAHKVAYENSVGKNPNPPVSLHEMVVNSGESMLDIARFADLELAELEKYNRWLAAPSVPADKAYTVLVPVTYENRMALRNQATSAAPAPEAPVADSRPASAAASFVTQNGIKAIVALSSDNKDRLAIKGGIKTRKFLKYNDLRSFDQIEEGKIYYLEAKRNKAEVEFHTAQVGESLQDIAQRYGIKEKAIRSKNRMKAEEVLVAGRVLWMQRTRPRQVPAEYRKVVDPNEVAPMLVAQSNAEVPSGPSIDLSAAPAPALSETADSGSESRCPRYPGRRPETGKRPESRGPGRLNDSCSENVTCSSASREAGTTCGNCSYACCYFRSCFATGKDAA